MKKINVGMLFIPFALGTFIACGPEQMSEDLKSVDLVSASDNYLTINGRYSEYGGCTDTLDNDGDGLTDTHDPDCHIDAGPLRDLSVAPAAVHTNFNPDVSKIFPAGPGYPGGFRDRAQITEWNRFLTEPDGYTGATALWGPGVNPAYVPVPQATATKISFGTSHQGNNNNINLRDAYDWYGDAAVPSVLPVAAPSSAESDLSKNASGIGYLGPKFGVPYKNGSQGYRNEVDTGNIDRKEDDN